MATMMNAFVMKKIGSVGMMEKPVPDPGPNDAIVRTTAAAVPATRRGTALRWR